MRLASLRKRVRGFTLLELLLSLGILVTMTALLLFNYPEAAIRITLVNSVHSGALLVREAQVRGSAVDSANNSIGGYGVVFTIPDLNDPSTVVLFGDTISNSGTVSSYGLPVGNSRYETAPIDETESTLTLPANYHITKICVGQGPSTCTTLLEAHVTISFTRPSPLPNIYLNGSTATSYSRACIEMQSMRAPSPGHTRSIEIFSSGMIRTTTAGCS